MRLRRRDPEEPGANRVDALAQRYGPGGDFDTLRAELDALPLDGLSEEELEAWFHLRGIVEFRTGRRDEARTVLEEGVRRFPASSGLQFSLGQEYEHVGRLDDAWACWRKVRLADVGGRTMLAIARYAYLWNRIEEGEQAIQPIFDAYYELGVVDDNFLYLRGLPFFGEAFGYRATFAVLGGRPERAAEELRRAKGELLEYDFGRLELDLEATISGDWSAVIAYLDGGPEPAFAYAPMRRAVLASRCSSALAEAFDLLDGVSVVPDRDFPWLEDIRLLAKAEAARRFGDGRLEAELLEEFFPRQRLLFEPDHAFRFGFIAYQELLKPRYRAGHGAG